MNSQRLPCNAPVACKEPHCGLATLTPCIRRRQIPASARARRWSAEWKTHTPHPPQLSPTQGFQCPL